MISICNFEGIPYQMTPELIERAGPYRDELLYGALRLAVYALDLESPVFAYVRSKVLTERDSFEKSFLEICVNHIVERDILAGDFAGARNLLDMFADLDTHIIRGMLELLCGDLFDPLVPQLDVTQWDLIVCNPPYVSTAEYEALDKNVKDYEPPTALLAGEDGLDVYRRLCEQIDRFLKPDGALMLEIGCAQGPAVRDLLERTALFATIAVEKDHQNHDRLIIARRRSDGEDTGRLLCDRSV